MEEVEELTANQQVEALTKKFQEEFKWVEEDYPIDLWRNCFECAKTAVKMFNDEPYVEEEE